MFGVQVDRSCSVWTTKLPRMGRGYVTLPVLNFGHPSISQEWLKLELSKFVQRKTISSLAKGMTIKSRLKGT